MRKRKIVNGLIFQEEACGFRQGVLCLCGDRIVTESSYRKAPGEELATDVSGGYVIPGLVDLHLHGCMGSDCCDGTANAFQAMAEYELRCGVAAIAPATMTLPERALLRICRAARGFTPVNGADFLGLYLEGPFISPAKKGAQNETFIRLPDTGLLDRLQEACGGIIRIAAVAPESEGAIPFIRENSKRLRISLGHTAADYDTAKKALENGASQLTHLFNAMPPLSHRAPGPIGAAAEDASCMAELICDGAHIHPSAVRAAFALFGSRRIILISDSMRATGLGDGVYDLGGQNVAVSGGVASLKDGTLAGSVTSLMGCLRTAVSTMGVPLADAVRCASSNPARALGVFGEYGTLAPGAYASIAILGNDLGLKAAFHRGEPVKGLIQSSARPAASFRRALF